MTTKRIGILTSGGDAPGMNTALRAATLVAAQRGVEVIGFERGWEGVLDGRYRPLTRRSRSSPSGLAPTHEVDTCGSLGGSILGSARSRRFYEAAGRAAAAARLAAIEGGIDGLVVIGGNGSLTGAHALATEHGVRYLGIPASIDNDIGCTSTCIGVDTALNTIVEACDRISDTARAHRRAFVVEVMGRQSGYLCMAAAVAAGADAALFREDGRTEEQLVDLVADAVVRGFSDDRGKQRVLVLKAEGVEVPCTRLVRRVQQRLEPSHPDLEIRATVLGHLVRGGNPSFLDRMVASRFALAAVTALLEGASGEMVAWQTPLTGGIVTVDRSVTRWPLARVLDETRALLDGNSKVVQQRVALMQATAGVLSL
ncbi:MAG: 6-phosphofructokinase [Sandaracinaceae bacterium]